MIIDMENIPKCVHKAGHLNYDSWTFTLKIGTKLSPIDFTTSLETMAALYEFQAMADGPKLPAPTSNAKTLQCSSLQCY